MGKMTEMTEMTDEEFGICLAMGGPNTMEAKADFYLNLKERVAVMKKQMSALEDEFLEYKGNQAKMDIGYLKVSSCVVTSNKLDQDEAKIQLDKIGKLSICMYESKSLRKTFSLNKKQLRAEQEAEKIREHEETIMGKADPVPQYVVSGSDLVNTATGECIPNDYIPF